MLESICGVFAVVLDLFVLQDNKDTMIVPKIIMPKSIDAVFIGLFFFS